MGEIIKIIYHSLQVFSPENLDFRVSYRKSEGDIIFSIPGLGEEDLTYTLEWVKIQLQTLNEIGKINSFKMEDKGDNSYLIHLTTPNP